jgi:hypothetical protein
MPKIAPDCRRKRAGAMIGRAASACLLLIALLPVMAAAADAPGADRRPGAEGGAGAEGSVDDVMMQVVEDPDAQEADFVDRIELPAPAREALEAEPGAERGRGASEAARARGEAAREAADAARGRGRPAEPGAPRAVGPPERPGGPSGPDRPAQPDAPGKPDTPGKPDSPGSKGAGERPG